MVSDSPTSPLNSLSTVNCVFIFSIPQMQRMLKSICNTIITKTRPASVFFDAKRLRMAGMKVIVKYLRMSFHISQSIELSFALYYTKIIS